MKLLIVTGILNSNWMKYIDAMEIPFPVVSAEVQSKFEKLRLESNKKGVIKTTREIIKQINSKMPQVIYLPDCLPQLEFWEQNESIKSLVFYSTPDLSVAQALAAKLMSVEECIDSSLVWKQQIKSAFKTYRKNKKKCMLVNCQDAFEHNKAFQDVISSFLDFEVITAKQLLPVSNDKLLAAKFLLQDQDELFDYYNEIRSDIPVFGEFNVSSVFDVSECALKAIEDHQSIYNKLIQSAEEQSTNLIQMQGELNRYQTQCADLVRKNHNLQENKDKLSANISDLYAANDKLKSQVIEQNGESELQILQISQLQEELESRMKILEISSQKYKQLEKQLSTEQNVGAEKLLELEAYNELASMQIYQLQEELEHYYLKLQEKESALMVSSETDNKTIHKVYDKCSVEQAEVISGYETEGYRDIQLKLEQVIIGDGRKFESIYCKLLEIDGRPAIEFRPIENNLNLQWLEEFKDEYGFYITYIPNPNNNQLAQQQKVDQRLNASDRLVILSIASLVHDALQLESLVINKEFKEGELRDWRLNAIDLKSQIAALPIWLSFDRISLVEEYRNDEYEHLWFRFEHLLINDQFFPEFEVKFAATGRQGEAQFTDQITIELRELASGFAPLQAWPPETKDDFGYKFQASINLLSDPLVIATSEKMSISDKQLIIHLVKNFNSFIDITIEQGAELSRDISDWNSIGLLLQRFESYAAPEQPAIKIEKQIKYNFRYAEFVDLGGYQHLVFEYKLEDENKLKLKVRAENINFEDDTANLAIEIRTGDEFVPLAESSYYAEDDYGPRVLFNLMDAQILILDDSLDSKQRNLMHGFINALPDLICTIEEIDEVTQQNWISWLSESRN